MLYEVITKQPPVGDKRHVGLEQLILIADHQRKDAMTDSGHDGHTTTPLPLNASMPSTPAGSARVAADDSDYVAA